MNGYLVPDLLEPGLKLVFCGTAPSRISAAVKAYYANPQNRFWRTLHTVGLTPRLLRPEEYPSLLHHRIGLTDLCKVASGNDDQLPIGAFDTKSLIKKITLMQPHILAFTSKTGGRAVCGAKAEYGWNDKRIGQSRIFILPSTSPRALFTWDIGPWQELAAYIRTCG